jgi:hypothetical protein
MESSKGFTVLIATNYQLSKRGRQLYAAIQAARSSSLKQSLQLTG